MEKDIFRRAERLLGSDVMSRLAEVRVVVFGVGGVGSWCAESLVRSGVRHLTIVDSDCVSVTNINRQLMATVHTVGEVKVDALKKRLLEINPMADITAVCEEYSEATADRFHLEDYDYIVDAIDSLKDKTLLILRACETSANLYSSMGAALKLDPQGVKVAEFWKVKGCPLGRALRTRFRSAKTYPAKKFQCVYSEELLPNLGDNSPEEIDERKAQINGSLHHVTAIFGLTLAGLIVKEVSQSLS